jgi:predicted DNA-binding ribbon-helix-helix protein
MKQSLVVKRSIVVDHHKTSVSLEDDFWNALRDIAHGRGETVSQLVGGIDAQRQAANLSSAIRTFVLWHYIDQSARQHETIQQHAAIV